MSLRASAAALVVGVLSSSLVLVGTAGGALSKSSNRPKSLVISTASNRTLGTILVSHTTLYTLDTAAAACGSKCLKVWPEVLLPKGVSKATAGPGVNAALLGTMRRSHGKLQVTYFGKPLYWFFLDKRPGQVKGNVTDKWGTWKAIVTARPAAIPAISPTTTSTKPASGATTTPTSRTTTPPSRTTTPTNPPTTTPPTTTPTTSPPPPTTTTSPPTTTTTSPGGGGIGF